MPTPGERPASALPSVRARALAFAAILVMGAAGAVIGASFVDIQCHGSCATPVGIGSIVGAVTAAGGTGVVVSLTLRAMGEWKRISDEQLLGEDADDPGDEPDAHEGVRSRKPSA